MPCAVSFVVLLPSSRPKTRCAVRLRQANVVTCRGCKYKHTCTRISVGRLRSCHDTAVSGGQQTRVVFVVTVVGVVVEFSFVDVIVVVAVVAVEVGMPVVIVVVFVILGCVSSTPTISRQSQDRSCSFVVELPVVVVHVVDFVVPPLPFL